MKKFYTWYQKLNTVSVFLMQGINLFLPIEKVCSKLNFPPAPEAERNRQCGSAGWSAEAVF